jgi:hypothetical protein
LPSDASFDVIHVLDEEPFVFLAGVSREEALVFVEERILPGIATGRRFKPVAVNNYASTDGRAKVRIVYRKSPPPTDPVLEK